MKLTHKTTLHTTESESEILEILAARKGISTNELMRHLILYQGLVGGDFPLTSEILSLPPPRRKVVEAKIVDRLKANEFLKPQSFMLWIKEVFGKIDADTMARGAKSFIRDLLGE